MAHSWTVKTLTGAASVAAGTPDRLLRFAVVLLALPTAILVLTGLGFAVGRSIGAATFWLALGASGAPFVWTRRAERDRASARAYDRLVAGSLWSGRAGVTIAAVDIAITASGGLVLAAYKTRLAKLRVPELVAELVLNHDKKGLQAIYNQHQYIEEKAEALEAWSRMLSDIVNATERENVVSMHG